MIVVGYAELARYVRLSRQRLYQLRDADALPPSTEQTFGGRPVWSTRVVDRWVRSR